MSLRSTVYFAGWGGDSLGWEQVPGVQGRIAANHNEVATAVHALNFPGTEHLPPGDVKDLDLAALPYTELFWASPACPAWTDAQGTKRHFDTSNQYTMFDEELGPIEDPAHARSRALVEQIPRYLRAMAARGNPVLAGVMENVIQCRRWDDWKRWVREIADLGYGVRLIALNSGHVLPRRCLPVPQSRDRLYFAFWLKSLGRQPDWDKWLRPRAWCASCERTVAAVQSWKKPGTDMGRYGIRHGQYVYRCPHRSCRAAIVEPVTTPASAAIDWTLPPGERIADRVDPLAEATMDRIRVGLTRFAGAPMLTPAGGTWRTEATSLSTPMPARTTRECDGLVIPPPTAVFPAPRPLLVPYNRTGRAHPVTDPLGTLTTKDRYALLGVDHTRAVGQCTFRMLADTEVRNGMAFPPTFRPLGDKRTRIRGYGNAVTPASAEVIGCALVEAVTGEQIERCAA
ncbi:DNA cytosine methyltransferase [Nocardia bovistercoris]|uniref:DNA cytosine methyltransferase n=1 Tax=Nocardia bovistercoris TaxID=2785916 RepID=A0A931N392_9NOCA|nr:DNA cytosine methyltransferase [Nocardia bovistercoris]MBH0780365.1 DNA cytosine methyltransferase [Nocardia bovistercoris]